METRLAHVKRIYFTDKDMVVDKTRWVDVLRIDRIFVSASPEKAASGVGKWITLKWDDEDQDWPTDNMDFEDIELTPPEDISGDPFPFKIAKKLKFSNNGQVEIWTFKNDDQNKSRKTIPVRIFYRDSTDITVDTTMEWLDYVKAFSQVEPDASQYIDTEIIDQILLSNTSQLSWNHYSTEELLKFTGKTEPTGDGNVYRLDPFQIIVNICWGAPVDIIHLIDASGSFSSFVDPYVVNNAKFFYKHYPGSRQGYANFVDYPMDPYGGPGDFVYRLFSPLKEKDKQSFSGWAQYDGDGQDTPEAQLDAMSLCAKDSRVGWTKKRPQIILCYTDTNPHVGDGTHITMEAFINDMAVYKIYPIYIGSNYPLAIGEFLTDTYPSAAQLIAAIDRGITYCRKNYLSSGA